MPFRDLVPLSRRLGEDFDREIGSAADVAPGDDRLALIANVEDVGLEHPGLCKDDIERCKKENSEEVRAQVNRELCMDATGDDLMPGDRRSIHNQLPVDDLVMAPVVRHLQEVVVRE